jgi:hypothetical protein
MTPMEKHLALADALLRLIREDDKALPALYTSAIGARLVEDGDDRARAYAQAVAQRLVRNLEQDSRTTLAPVPGSGGINARGRVTDERLDMRLKKNRGEPTE